MLAAELDFVGWALPPGAKLNTRPFKLLTELSKLDGVSDKSEYYFHGRAASTGSHHNAGHVVPRIRRQTSSGVGALFSPVFIPALQPTTVRWIDLYDDWSLAPDINPLHRMVSAHTYRWLRDNWRSGSFTVTCNSRYMAGKLGLPQDAIIPNGVDEHLADIPRLGDGASRLVLLGHFFPGRTDFDLIKSIADAKIFEEIVIGGPGKSPEMKEAIESCQKSGRVRVFDWLSNEELCGLVGAATVALAPNKVSDYTLSQDLMKVYQLLALGIRVICPAPLWPPGVSIEHAFLYGHGARLTPNLADWVNAGQISDVERREFVEQHSWRSRALSVVQRLS